METTVTSGNELRVLKARYRTESSWPEGDSWRERSLYENPGGSTMKQQKDGYVDDSVITTKVRIAVFNEPTLKSAEINVETFNGVVQLSGFVSSAADERNVTELARSIAGVKLVRDDIWILGRDYRQA